MGCEFESFTRSEWILGENLFHIMISLGHQEGKDPEKQFARRCRVHTNTTLNSKRGPVSMNEG